MPKSNADAGLDLHIWGYDTPTLLGIVDVTVVNNDKKVQMRFHVMKGDTGTLLGCNTSEDLGLVFFAKQIQESHAETIMREFPQLFYGLGRLKNK